MKATRKNNIHKSVDGHNVTTVQSTIAFDVEEEENLLSFKESECKEE